MNNGTRNNKQEKLERIERCLEVLEERAKELKAEIAEEEKICITKTGIYLTTMPGYGNAITLVDEEQENRLSIEAGNAAPVTGSNNAYTRKLIGKLTADETRQLVQYAMKLVSNKS